MRHRLTWLALSLLIIPFAAAGEYDWPQWQGIDRNALSREKGLLQEWPKDGPKLEWQISDVGDGYSTPAVVGGRLYLISNKGKEEEFVAARQVKDGTPVWSTPSALLPTLAVCAGDLRLGIIGCDTSHVIAFTETLNNPDAKDHVPGGKVVASFRGGSLSGSAAISSSSSTGISEGRAAVWRGVSRGISTCWACACARSAKLRQAPGSNPLRIKQRSSYRICCRLPSSYSDCSRRSRSLPVDPLAQFSPGYLAGVTRTTGSGNRSRNSSPR